MSRLPTPAPSARGATTRRALARDTALIRRVLEAPEMWDWRTIRETAVAIGAFRDAEPHLSRLLNVLVTEGDVEKRPHPHDGRSVQFRVRT